jgi:hypothetical protein
MIEVAAVLDHYNVPIHWHVPPGRSSGHIPDTRSLWEVIWENRDIVGAVAHTHPGSGKPGPSIMDITTFMAIEAGLGRELAWWISSSDQTVQITHNKGDQYVVYDVDRCPHWTHYLRHLSGMKGY